MNGDATRSKGGAFTFERLLELEDRVITEGAKQWAGPDDASEPPALKVEVDGLASDEPWVRFTNRDRFGLAFSGGGIRSASFNLGVLQTLAEKGWLAEVDYLSTVSGGGYIGGFWSALRRQHGAVGALEALARWRKPGSGSRAEPHEVRHLRQFSRFLVPRLGALRLETWAAILAVVAGLLPTAVLAASALTLCCALFVGLSPLLVTAEGASAFSVLAAVVAAGVTELNWLHRRRIGESGLGLLLMATCCCACGGALFAYVGELGALEPALAAAMESLRTTPLEERLRFVLPGVPTVEPWTLNTALLLPAGVFGCSALVAIILRLVTSRLPRVSTLHGRSERLAVWLLRTGVLWATVVLVWELARHERDATFRIGASGAAAGGLFLWLREWLRAAPGGATGVVTKVPTWLKPLASQVLAFAAVLAFTVAGTALFQVYVDSATFWRAVIAASACFVVIGLFVDTSRVGLHVFYRRRLARAFLGAARADGQPPATHSDERDDFAFQELDGRDAARNAKAVGGPVHLVCCAANDVRSESLQMLARGGRSVAVSPLGLSVGNFARPPWTMKLSAALTASGAAVNSQMGTLSVKFGDAVSVLLSLFNLRLGLWTRHPLSPPTPCFSRALRPLRQLAIEAFGATEATPVRDALTHYRALREREQTGTGASPSPDLANLHLSDGGHFENLGLYELVRRHCRYIIVSDAGADPDLAFDDLGNAIRRVREDFAVEVDIDVEPLRVRDGFSQQHVVVGTIHYDGLNGTDKGTLLYMKPTLVGGEPPDVRQYHERNRTFPHEGTADQFYDEPQWESYRRLGEHITAVALHAADSDVRGKALPVDALFLSLRKAWHAAPTHTTETFLAYTERCSALESELEAAPLWFRVELFPELAALETVGGTPTLAEVSEVVTRVMQMAQLMEDVWLAARLDLYWSHPLNEGWMTYFHRWAQAPSFRLWWPLLRGIYSNGFRNFVRERFDLTTEDASRQKEKQSSPAAVLDLCHDDAAWDRCAARMGLPLRADYRYAMTLQPAVGSALTRPLVIPVATLDCRERGDGVVEWRMDELKVPEWLMGNGVQARFLNRVIEELPGKALEVQVTAGGERDPGSRARLTQAIAFYKSRSFSYHESARTLRRDPPRARLTAPV
ncbi:MAG: hypothetical protein ACOZQL_08205 [Myxococcota bacterium]